jgi:hypothetical protein
MLSILDAQTNLNSRGTMEGLGSLVPHTPENSFDHPPTPSAHRSGERSGHFHSQVCALEGERRARSRVACTEPRTIEPRRRTASPHNQSPAMRRPRLLHQGRQRQGGLYPC